MNFQVKFVDHMVCEIGKLKKGEITCANRMLIERVHAMDKHDAMMCLIEAGEDDNRNLISYLYEQVKEITTKLILTI